MNISPTRIISTRPGAHPASELINQFIKQEPNMRIMNYIRPEDFFEVNEGSKLETTSPISSRTSPVTPKLWVDTIPSVQDSAISLQKWEGVVIEVKKDSFIAELHDLTTENIEEAELLVDDISDEDKPLIESGAIFYWGIGYCKTHAGQVKKESIIRFRRLPTWTNTELTRAKKEAKESWEDIVGR